MPLKQQHPHPLLSNSNLKGTDFQKRVWAALLEIPAGQTLTYGELAQKLNSHPRAIGQACRTNPYPVVIPCHRVVSKTGFGGYAGAVSGDLLNFKKWLLQREKAQTSTQN